jgi:hypothetical protein
LPWWKTRSRPDRIAVTAMQQIADLCHRLCAAKENINDSNSLMGSTRQGWPLYVAQK